MIFQIEQTLKGAISLQQYVKSKNGKNRKGEKLFAVSPLKKTNIPVEVVSQHYVDPDGERVRS